MKVVYAISSRCEDTLFEAISNQGNDAIRVADSSFFEDHRDAGLFIDTIGQGEIKWVNAPLLIHSPDSTWSVLKGLPAQSARLCFWPGFMERNLWELVPHPESNANWNEILTILGKKACILPDDPGMISPRILATLINEAVYCLSEGIADSKDIDVAMRLGTNYPLGPIEWAKRIGSKEVYNLLCALALKDKKYSPHRDFLEILGK